MNNTPVQFDLQQLFWNAWEVLKKNASPLVGGCLVAMVIVLVSNLVYIGPLILSGPLSFGLFKMTRLALRGEEVDFMVLFSGFQRFLDAFLAYLVILVFTLIGSLFCIIPGLLISILYMPTYLFLIDRQMTFWEAMEASRKMVMNNLGQWILLALAIFAISLVGLLACCIGWVVTAPLSLVMITMAYDMEQGGVLDVAAEPVTAPEPPVE